MHHRLRMEARGAASENLDKPVAQARTAPGRCDDQRAVEPEPRRFVRNSRERAGREYDALGREIMNERRWHATSVHVRRDAANLALSAPACNHSRQ
jgi:hypothetical protein